MTVRSTFSRWWMAKQSRLKRQLPELSKRLKSRNSPRLRQGSARTNYTLSVVLIARMHVRNWQQGFGIVCQRRWTWKSRLTKFQTSVATLICPASLEHTVGNLRQYWQRLLSRIWDWSAKFTARSERQVRRAAPQHLDPFVNGRNGPLIYSVPGVQSILAVNTSTRSLGRMWQ